MTKTCSKCKENLKLEDFNPRKISKDGYNNRCKKCISLQRKEYRDSNQEKIKLQKLESYNRNKNNILLSNKKYYSENKEKCKSQSSNYYAENKEEQKITQKRWRDNNKTKIAEMQSNYYSENRAKVLLRKANFYELEKNKSMDNLLILSQEGTWLYYELLFTHKELEIKFIKFGITKNNVSIRYRDITKFNIEIISEQRGTKDYVRALERKIKLDERYVEFIVPKNIGWYQGSTECRYILSNI